MVTGIGNDPATFPSPTPTLPVVTASLQNLQAAETKAGTKARGTAPARNRALKSARNYLRALAQYVQAIADQLSVPATTTAKRSRWTRGWYRSGGDGCRIAPRGSARRHTCDVRDVGRRRWLSSR